MTKKKGIIIAIAGIVALLSYLLSGQISFKSSRDKWSMETIQVDNGWGYVIKQNKSVIINQDIIPAIPMRVPFATKEAASKVGKVVLDKISNNEIPSVSKKELQELGVIDSLYQPISK